MLCVSCVSHAFASIHCCLVVTCWERADLLALVGDVYCIFVTFPCGILGQVWYLIVSFPDLCRLSNFGSKLFHTLMVFLHCSYFIFFFYKNLKKQTNKTKPTTKLKFEELINYCYI